MKTKLGLWIDHRKAVIVTVSGKGKETDVQVVETVDQMTDRQIAAKVREYYN